MWVFDILVPILILGTLSSTIAEEEIPNGNEQNSTETTELCGLYIGVGELDGFKHGWEIFSNCSEFLNTTELEDESGDAFWSDDWDPLVKKYCPKVPSLLECAGHVIDSIKPCLDTETKKITEVDHNTTRTFLEFICANDGQRILSLLNHRGVECLGSESEALQVCRSELSNDKNRIVPGDAIWVDVGRSDCAGIAKYETCVSTALRVCEDKVPADVVQSIIDQFKSIKSCPTVATTEASPAA